MRLYFQPCIGYTIFVPVLFLTSKGREINPSIKNLFSLLHYARSAIQFPNDVLNKGSEEPEEDTLGQQIESLRQQFLVHQIRLQFIQDQINDLSKIPTASSGDYSHSRCYGTYPVKAVCKLMILSFNRKRANLSNLRDKNAQIDDSTCGSHHCNRYDTDIRAIIQHKTNSVIQKKNTDSRS